MCKTAYHFSARVREDGKETVLEGIYRYGGTPKEFVTGPLPYETMRQEVLEWAGLSVPVSKLNIISLSLLYTQDE